MHANDCLTIGTHIRHARKEVRLTQADLADLIGVSERTVRDIEGGTGGPSLKSVVGAANALGLHIGVGG